MKKGILILLLAGGLYHAKAQQLQLFKPADSLATYFKGLPSDTSNLLFRPKYKYNDPLNGLKQVTVGPQTEVVYSNMPVVKTRGYDNMPIVRTDEAGMKYTMLIKRIQSVSPLAATTPALQQPTP